MFRTILLPAKKVGFALLALTGIGVLAAGILFAARSHLISLEVGNILHRAAPYLIASSPVFLGLALYILLKGPATREKTLPKLSLEETLRNIPPDEIFNKDDPQVGVKQQFYELIRRGFPTVKERKELYNKLDQINDDKIKALKSSFYTHSWSVPLFKNEFDQIPYIALAAVQKGEISVFDFDFIMAYWTAKKEYKQKAQWVPLFNGEEINQEALGVIKQTLANNHYFSHRNRNRDPLILSDKQMDELIKKWKELPKSQQQFVLVPQERGGGLFQPNSISNHLYGIGMNVFRYAKYKGSDVHMVPSCGMTQAFLDVAFGDHQSDSDMRAVKINPVIGLSSLGDIENNGLFRTRDVCTPFPGVKIPDTADLFGAPKLCFRDHDLFHCYISSKVPASHAQAFIHLGSQTKAKVAKREIADGFLYPHLFLDMENFEYDKAVFDPLSRTAASLSKAFFNALNFMLNRTNRHQTSTFNTHIISKLYQPDEATRKLWLDEFSIILG